MLILEEWNNLDDEEPTIHLVNLANKYQRYTSDTLSGNLGKTAQFWMTYSTIVELSSQHGASLSINSIELYAYSLLQLTSIFFITNHPNYARWMTYYALELTNLKKDRPELLDVLEKGVFRLIGQVGRSPV